MEILPYLIVLLDKFQREFVSSLKNEDILFVLFMIKLMLYKDNYLS